MNKNKVLFILVVLVLSLSLFACSPKGEEISIDSNTQTVETEAVVAATEAPEQPEAIVETEFPVLPDAENVMDAQGTLIYQTATKMSDVFDFYKKELSAKGLTENEILTLNDETVSQLVFTGSENGKSLIVQMTKLSETSVSVAIRYE
ncbi:MAG: hypothetical protein FP831_13335 [Anaerolineae bacterium]|nr:hypothetical protein [Anaerolineae bacterium]